MTGPSSPRVKGPVSSSALALYGAAAGVSAFIAIALLIGHPPLADWDAAGNQYLHRFADPQLDTAMRTITSFGSTTTLAVVVAVGIVALTWSRHARWALF